tara:strand:- start:40 stop:252 length:213 start_codon:yes stop_codon:yes gene_type:complete
MKLRIFRNIQGSQRDKFPDGKEYLLDTENNNEPAEFESMEDILNLFKNEASGIETEQDLINWGLNIEEVK